jgi:hypothetical protein
MVLVGILSRWLYGLIPIGYFTIVDYLIYFPIGAIGMPILFLRLQILTCLIFYTVALRNLLID